MKTYLQLNTSLHGADSQSSRLARQFVATLARTDRSADAAAAPARVIVRDLASQPLPHLTAERLPRSSRLPSSARRDQARHRRRVGRARGRTRRGGRARHRTADVQLRRPVDAQGVLRSRRACGRDLSLHGQRSGRLAARQACLRHRDARRQARGHAQRPAERLRAAVPRLHRHHRRRVRLRRGPGDGRGKPHRGARCSAASASNNWPPDAPDDSALLQRRVKQALSISQERNER